MNNIVKLSIHTLDFEIHGQYFASDLDENAHPQKINAFHKNSNVTEQFLGKGNVRFLLTQMAKYVDIKNTLCRFLFI
jgi:hypothetical protein